MPNTKDDSFRVCYFERSNRYGTYLIELFECLGAKGSGSARFLAAPHRGYPTPFNISLIGQASTAVAATAMCRRKVHKLLPEEIQATPPGTWIRMT